MDEGTDRFGIGMAAGLAAADVAAGFGASFAADFGATLAAGFGATFAADFGATFAAGAGCTAGLATGFGTDVAAADFVATGRGSSVRAWAWSAVTVANPAAAIPAPAHSASRPPVTHAGTDREDAPRRP